MLRLLAQIVKSSDAGGSRNEFQRRRIKCSSPYLRQYPGHSLWSERERYVLEVWS